MRHKNRTTRKGMGQRGGKLESRLMSSARGREVEERKPCLNQEQKGHTACSKGKKKRKRIICNAILEGLKRKRGG